MADARVPPRRSARLKARTFPLDRLDDWLVDEIFGHVVGVTRQFEWPAGRLRNDGCALQLIARRYVEAGRRALLRAPMVLRAERVIQLSACLDRHVNSARDVRSITCHAYEDAQAQALVAIVVRATRLDVLHATITLTALVRLADTAGAALEIADLALGVIDGPGHEPLRGEACRAAFAAVLRSVAPHVVRFGSDLHGGIAETLDTVVMPKWPKLRVIMPLSWRRAAWNALIGGASGPLSILGDVEEDMLAQLGSADVAKIAVMSLIFAETEMSSAGWRRLTGLTSLTIHAFVGMSYSDDSIRALPSSLTHMQIGILQAKEMHDGALSLDRIDGFLLNDDWLPRLATLEIVHLFDADADDEAIDEELNTDDVHEARLRVTRQCKRRGIQYRGFTRRGCAFLVWAPTADVQIDRTRLAFYITPTCTGWHWARTQRAAAARRRDGFGALDERNPLYRPCTTLLVL